MSGAEVRHIPLEALHRELGAKFGPFAGYEMPIQYPAGLKAEHAATRERAGLFDVSHMGQLRIRAKDGSAATLARGLEAALPVDFDGWAPGLQKYSLLLNDAGGIEDDLMLVNLGDEVRMVVNAGNRDADFAALVAACPTLTIEWVDAALVALQGPAAEAVLAALDPAAASMTFMQARTLALDGAACFTTRSGYTGEDGYEISLPLEAAERVARRLLADPRVAPVGLGARDTLRLEAGLPLHGNDISPTVTPVEAGLAFAIPRSRRSGGGKAGGFPGAATILRQLVDGPPRRLVALVSSEPVPVRAHAAILDASDATVGEVTSGTVSPTLGRPVMLALLDAAALDGRALRAAVRDKRPALERVQTPFVPKRYKR
ncbi:MAG: glycine cleavage system aminomethyltransferase GcvT [Burkholderiales bacterium]|nr:MAG: glycine cleavage system aminomethyltransferase GcvT [Burkholderiales bacterium]